MKLPYSWLSDYTDVSVDAKEYAHRMTMTGSKVEGWENAGDEKNRNRPPKYGRHGPA